MERGPLQRFWKQIYNQKPVKIQNPKLALNLHIRTKLAPHIMYNESMIVRTYGVAIFVGCFP